jgi:hypothetical protein
VSGPAGSTRSSWLRERATGTDGAGDTTYLAMQEDGNVVLQRGDVLLGATDTHGGSGRRLVLRDDGRLVLRDWLGREKSLNVLGNDVIDVLARDAVRRPPLA